MAVRSADPVVTDEEFKTALRQVASPVGIVTARSGNMRDGVTSTAISPVSAEPPTLLVCVNRDSSVGRLIVESGAFAVNFLAQEQYSFAHLFAVGAEAAQDRFTEGNWTAMHTGSPILDGCVSAFDCELDNTISTGTHDVHFGRIVGVTTERQDVLLYCDGLLRRLKSLD
jgi:flavin reductase